MSTVNKNSDKDFLMGIDSHVNWCDSTGKQFVSNTKLDKTETFSVHLFLTCGRVTPPQLTSPLGV